MLVVGGGGRAAVAGLCVRGRVRGLSASNKTVKYLFQFQIFILNIVKYLFKFQIFTSEFFFKYLSLNSNLLSIFLSLGATFFTATHSVDTIVSFHSIAIAIAIASCLPRCREE